MAGFEERMKTLASEYEALATRPNMPLKNELNGNGICIKYEHPVVTWDHVPLFWRYDFNPETNPRLQERMGTNATFNTGAICLEGKIYLCMRTEGVDRKSFFTIVESDSGVDNFRYWRKPILMPETDRPDINVYDMRLTQHEDGWIYGVFCTERHHPDAKSWETTAAEAQCGIARTKNLQDWERFDDIRTPSNQQRNVVLHPEFVDGKYAFYTRPQHGFIDVGESGGIGWGLADDITHAVLDNEIIIDGRDYHTIKELKNGAGAPPIKTSEGWLHIAHGVRETATGFRYVLYVLLCDPDEPWKVIHRPGGYFLAPQGRERVGDLWSILFCCGTAVRGNDVYIYYASGDTQTEVATTTIDRLLDYTLNTPEDPLRSRACAEKRCQLIDANVAYAERSGNKTLRRMLDVCPKPGLR